MKGALLITGASRGIGQVLKSYYLSTGWEVYDFSRTSGVDLRSEWSIIRGLVKLPKLSGVIHNAGIWVKDPEGRSPIWALNECFQVNCLGPAILQWHLDANDRLLPGAVVTSVLSRDIQRKKMPIKQVAYNVSKAAMEALHKTWEAEYKGRYRFVALYPGATPIGMTNAQWDPELGPLECTVEETLDYITRSIDKCLNQSTQSSTSTQLSKQKETLQEESPSS